MECIWCRIFVQFSKKPYNWNRIHKIIYDHWKCRWFSKIFRNVRLLKETSSLLSLIHPKYSFREMTGMNFGIWIGWSFENTQRLSTRYKKKWKWKWTRKISFFLIFLLIDKWSKFLLQFFIICFHLFFLLVFVFSSSKLFLSFFFPI